MVTSRSCRRRGVVHRHLIRALDGVVGRHECELRAVVSWTVMVCVAEELLPASSVAVNVRRSRSCRSIASGGLARHFDGHLTAVVRRRGVIHRHLVWHSAV